MSDIQAIKYRLVGAVVIVVGFACLWWLMLDHETHRRIKNEQVEIPEQTLAVERFDIEEPRPLNIHPKKPDVAAELQNTPAASHEEIKTAEVKTVVVSDSRVSGEVKKEIKVIEEKAPVEPKSIAKAGSYSALGADGLPEAWVLQLASLKNKENAQQLQRKLLADSYPAYIKSVTKADGVSYRVLVGPKLSRDKANELSKTIEKEHGIKSLIVKFQAGYEQ